MPTAPGVLPGSPVVTLLVDLTINGDQCSLPVHQKQIIVLSYKGEVSAGAMELALSEVKLKNAKLAGMTWKLKPYNQEVEEQDPVRLVWESEKNSSFGSLKCPVESVLKIIMHAVDCC